MSRTKPEDGGIDITTATDTPPDLDSIISKLTLEEKVSLLSGKDFWMTVPITDHGVPSLKMSDGPNGARGGLFKGGLSSACFPAGVSLAATFDRELAGRIGKALAEETRSKGANVLLGPTVCPHRDPRGGRNFESFSEDPLLAGEVASAYINGLQAEGVGATIKHYAANEQETKRFTIDARVSQRALREIYLKPFEIAVKKSDPWALMTSYNVVNGVHADGHIFLIEKVLRGEWGYQGLVMSDWGGTNSTVESLNAGLDLEMPGPGTHRNLDKVTAAVEKGQVLEEVVDQRVKKSLELLVKTDRFTSPEIPPEKAVDLPEHRKLIRQAGAEGIVLLKNTGNYLPLKQPDIKSIALLGLAKEFLGHGGGSASVNAHHKITPYQAFQEAVGDSIQLHYARGASILRNLRPLSQNVTNEEGSPGFTIRLFTSDSTTPTISTARAATFQSLENPRLTLMTMNGTFTPEVSGSHYLSFVTAGGTTIKINDEIIFQTHGASADVMACLFDTAAEERKQYSFTAGQAYRVHIEATVLTNLVSDMSVLSNPLIYFNLGFELQEVLEADLYTPAVEQARSSDVAIVFVGHTATWETEGCDRESIDLPMNGSQDKLIAGVASVNKRTIVVNNTGSPISMPWINDVAAVVQAWFPGQEAGYAISDVLFGHVNPSGKLPVSFPKRIEDAPTAGNFPGNMQTLRVDYKEDIFMGYRYYDKHSNNVLFPFGFGLSYTTFKISQVRSPDKSCKPDQEFTVSALVQNTGTVEGSEVVQVYVGPAEDQKRNGVERPKKILAGWGKIRDLAPGQSVNVSVTVSVKESTQYWDEEKYKWIVLEGRYVVYVGTSSAEEDITEKVEINITEEVQFGP